MFNWSKQVILLTGGTGSFGQAFTKYILSHHPPKSLRIFSRDEYKQYIMQQQFNHECLRYFIGDVRDEARLRRAMDGVTLVVHAAAMKQIVASEYNPTEAIKTNIGGTINIIDAAIDASVDRVFGLITDKAVSPINLYGATKLCMEKLLIQSNSYVGSRSTKISCIRYGNVAGSRGSIIPLFLEQKKSGILTITDKNMTRFWITLEEGVRFVVEFIEQMSGGEVFIPKMPSFKVFDVAKVIAPEANIDLIGVRPGEKLHEDLITFHESRNIREFPKNYVLTPQFDFWKETSKQSQGKKVPAGFSYSSLNNIQWLGRKDLEDLLKKLRFLS